MYVLSGQKRYPLQRWPRALQVLHALLYSTIITFPFIVTIVFWGILNPDSPVQDDSYDSAFARSLCIVSVLTTCRVSVLLRSLVRGDIPLDELALRRTRDYVHTRSATTVATRTSVGSDISWLLRRRVHHARNARFLQYDLPPSLPPATSLTSSPHYHSLLLPGPPHPRSQARGVHHRHRCRRRNRLRYHALALCFA